ncbi:MAG: methyltransferase domain-containing protein [Oscillospiraceae bacterium]
MRERVQIQDFNALWAAEVQKRDTPRMTDDGAEQDFWKAFMARKEGYAPDSSSRLVVQRLLPLLHEYAVKTALELGPGWGNYTLDLASVCERVDCVDISSDVLDFVMRVGGERGFFNLLPHHVKWEDFFPEHKVDLVFGYNCFYRQADLRACFEKMDQAAEKLCVVGMNTGLAPAWLHELERAGAEVSWEWKDYIYFINVLYSMGIDPNVAILPFEKKTVYSDAAAMVTGECARLKPGTYDVEKARKILLRRVCGREDGSFEVVAKLHSALVWWRPRKPAARDSAE